MSSNIGLISQNEREKIMIFDLEQIHKAVTNLSRLMPAKLNKDSPREYSLKETIFLMAPKLLEMRQMGFTTKELVKSLADEKIIIKSATLNRYLCEFQQIGNEEAAAKPKKKKAKKDADPVEDESDSIENEASPESSLLNEAEAENAFRRQ